MVHNIQKDEENLETDIEIGNINSIRFNSNHSPIIANSKTSVNKVVITAPYKVDTGSDGNIMPFYMYKKLFPRATADQLVGKKIQKLN